MHILMHLNGMKYLVVILILFIGFQTAAQDTLFECNTFMYNNFYVIQNDNQFVHIYTDCTGYRREVGSVTKKSRKWVFQFAPQSIREPYCECETADAIDSVDVCVLDINTGLQSNAYYLVFNGVMERSWDSFVRLPMEVLESGNLSLKGPERVLKVECPTGPCSRLRVYVNDPNQVLSNEKKLVIRKRKNTFFYKAKGRDQGEGGKNKRIRIDVPYCLNNRGRV